MGELHSSQALALARGLSNDGQQATCQWPRGLSYPPRTCKYRRAAKREAAPTNCMGLEPEPQLEPEPEPELGAQASSETMCGSSVKELRELRRALKEQAELEAELSSKQQEHERNAAVAKALSRAWLAAPENVHAEREAEQKKKDVQVILQREARGKEHARICREIEKEREAAKAGAAQAEAARAEAARAEAAQANAKREEAAARRAAEIEAMEQLRRQEAAKKAAELAMAEESARLVREAEEATGAFPYNP